MDFIKTPVKGMPEQMPNDMEVREFALRKIKDTYKKFGFMQISTPYIEHIENLTNKQGGENETLIFKIMKRGEKLTKADSVEDMCDSGLRYDLTVPLARFYANNNDNLPSPFKALQIGDVFRADRPQKGRFRQFTQCDIDILGDSSNLAEIELISATANMLNELGIKELKVRVNDRNILKAMALACNFPEDQLGTIYIILDKIDKIGIDGVKKCLLDAGLNEVDVENYCKFFDNLNDNIDCKEFLNTKLKGFLADEVIENLNQIISCASNIVSKDCQIVFDPTLVRGMGYYTGPIFEIELKNYHASVAGGGRYDKMIGKYCNKEVCACGFSIGFERIISVIKENNLLAVEQTEKIAVLIAKDVDSKKIQQTIKRANELRSQGKTVMLLPRNSNAKFQKEKLSNFGVTEFVEIFNDKGSL
mgnify:CR=1 FL=1